MKEHYPECPQGRDRHNECVCDLLRACRAAGRRKVRELREDEREDQP